MAQELSNNNEELALLQYPGVGVLSRVNARGYGYIKTKSSDKFCHINDHAGRRLETMLDLEGRQCMYVVGGHPRRYMENKEGWNRWVVKWRLIDELEITSASSYRQARANSFANINTNTLRTQLTANWYVQSWQSKTGHMPMATLRPDDILDKCVHDHLKKSESIEELIGLLADLVNSPWYAASELERESTCKKFYRPEEWAESLYTGSRCPPSQCNGFADIVRYCGDEFLARFRAARTVAIDLETNGELIYEFGWKNSKGTGIRKSAGYLSKTEIKEAVSECTPGPSSACIVGHNIIDWDIPVLRKNDVILPEGTQVWDTLITSWVLEPWLKSHALVAGKRAHCADVDAEACYKLFEDQVARLGHWIYGQALDTASLVNCLYEETELFAQFEWREYPSGLSETLEGSTIYPLCRAKDFAWQRNCLPKFLARENVLLDPILVPESCRAIADQEQTIQAKVIAAVVCDARRNNVYIHLSDLPGWLVDDDLKTVLREAHKHYEDDEEIDMALIYIAEDFFKLSDDEVDRRFAAGTLAIAYPGDVAAVWMEARCQKLRVEEVGTRFPAAVEGTTGRFLQPVQDVNGTAAWLLHLPSPFGITQWSSWFLLPAMPSWLQIDTDQKQIKSASLAQIPRWRDGDSQRLDVDRIFISPDTANRPLYLADLTQCILSLLKGLSKDEVMVLGVRWPEEATQVQRNLVCIGVSAEHPGTPLRQLEYLAKKGLQVLACVRDRIPDFIQAAKRLGTKIQVVLDEVPLHDWYAILNAPSAPVRTSMSRLTDITSVRSEDDEETNSGASDKLCARVVLHGSDICTTTNVFLDGWLCGMGMSVDEVSKCLILDARLVEHHPAVAAQIAQQDVGFYSLEELLDTETLQVLYSVCYPKREVQAIPNDYESYRAFLKENWGFEDFRAGTQRPAIERLIASNRDMLLRLPTGAGKSVIFHLPALFRSSYSGRLTVVITPLRALMRDQAEGLWRKNFTESVDFLSGGRDPWVNHEVYQGILDGRLRLVFVSPERFRVPRFIEALERRRRMDDGLEFVVFDEAHCISEWGFEFRPDYLHAAQHVANWYKKKRMPGNPHRFLLTSATVTQRNRIDMEKELALGKGGSYDDIPEEMPHPIQPYIVLESLELAEEEEAPSDEKFEELFNILKRLDLERSAALVFVQRRKDCHRISEALNERVSISNSGLSSLHALPFHAGLPEAVKIQTCDQLRDRKANVLICTKAFGMGMDIPHVHACIHHRPPTFIEDYLQEVGRIGRDEGERARAGHDLVTATLLYNQNDFERNLSLLHNNAVSPPDLQDLFAYCIESSVRFDGVGKSLCLVSSKVQINQTKQFDENRVSNCLFWLERMGVLRIEGRQPPFLSLSIDVPGLHSYSKGSSLASRIAASLAGILAESDDAIKELAVPAQQEEARPQVETVFGRFIKGLLAGVLALFSPSRAAEPEPEVINPPRTSVRPPTPKKLDVSISMSELMLRCGDISMDELFAGLFELSVADVVSVHKSFAVLKSGTPSGEEFYDLLEFAVNRLLQPTEGRVDILERKKFESELRERYQQILAPFGQPIEEGHEVKDFTRHQKRRIQREVYRAISTSLRILRYAGFELREGLSESGVAYYARSIPRSFQVSAFHAVHMSIEAMRRFVDFISSSEDRSSQSEETSFNIRLTDIISAFRGDIRIGQIKQLMKLVESAGFYEFESGLGDWVTLVTLNTLEPLPSHTPDSSEDTEVHRVYTEMLERHELQVLRAQAMVLMAAMPKENRRKYIDLYFQCINAAGLTQLLEDTVGDVGDEILANSPMLQDLLSQVRRERFSEEMEKLNSIQRTVCAAPFDRTLLVNAGPGSGKTHVLMMRCAHLIHRQRIDPAEILVLAFNRAVVFEIRDRVSRLFSAIGYGSYANRLSVTTFHSLALRFQLESELYEEDAIGQAVHAFAERMASDSEFARYVGGGYKTVLVDEFQDMNQDFYSVVKVLLENCRGGGMVIGDDDQDILAWNRRKWQDQYRRRCPLDAYQYFSDFRDSNDPTEHTLTHNYRSAVEIVSRSSGMITKAAETLGFTRMKVGTNLEPERTDSGYVEISFDIDRYTEVLSQSLERGESVALLCRSNRECRQNYDLFVKASIIPAESIELLGSQDFPLYQMRHSGALIDICNQRNDYDFVEPYIWEEFIDEFKGRGLADSNMGQRYLELIYELVKSEVGRPRVRDLQSFLGEMRGSDVERLKARIDAKVNPGRLTIATMHKVKGLEFDTVIIMPSTESFPFSPRIGQGSAPTAVEAAEEARLYYVAMTRARTRLYGGWGNRERAWWRCDEQGAEQGSKGFRLEGSPSECFVSWPGQRDQVQRGIQTYIERHIRVGDPLHLRDRCLLHDGHSVGLLSRNAATSLLRASEGSQLRVSNVIRYTCGNYFQEHNPSFWDKIDDGVKRQGWFYLVLAEQA